MLDTLLLVGLGCLIGWHVPQPVWAKYITDKIVGWVKALLG